MTLNEIEDRARAQHSKHAGRLDSARIRQSDQLALSAAPELQIGNRQRRPGGAGVVAQGSKLPLLVRLAVLGYLARHATGRRGDGRTEDGNDQRRELAADHQDERERDHAADVAGRAADELVLAAAQVGGLRARRGRQVGWEAEFGAEGERGAVVPEDVFEAGFVEG